jgi:hypothetical protein
MIPQDELSSPRTAAELSTGSVPELPALRPHRQLAAKHLELLTGDPGTAMCFRILDGSYLGDRKPTGTLADCWGEIVTAQAAGAQVFVVVNEGGQSDAEITRIRALFVDMDGKKLPDSWHVDPDFLVIRDATHWHAYWLVEGMEPSAFRTAQKRLAARYGSDPVVCNPSRVMRLAGSVHTKLPPHGDGIPRLVTLVDNGTAEDRHAGIRPFHTAADLLAELPEVSLPTAEPRKSEVTATDRPAAIKRFQSYLERNPIPPEGDRSDDACYRAIARGRDLGLSDDTILQHLETATEFDPDWLEEKLSHVEIYAQNEPGCDSPQTAAEAHAGLIANVVAANPASETDGLTELGIKPPGQRRFVPHDPRDPATMPALSFFDADHMVPQSPDGTIGIMYGKRGDHKTNAVLAMLAGSTAQRILYIAGEGAYGVERDRVSLHPGLKGRIKLLGEVPLLGSPEQVEQFIDDVNSINWRPEIVVIDTLATALVGLDENGGSAAEQLTNNGTAGTIKQAWNCTLMLIAHTGKDQSKGVRGHSGFEANSDFLIRVEADKKHGAIKTTLERMRNGYDGFSVHWKYDTSPEVVPVPVRINAAEYDKLTAAAAQPDEAAPVGMVVKSYLHLHGHRDWLTGVEVPELALFLTEQEHGPRPTDPEHAAAWDTIKGNWRKSLGKLKSKAWAKPCHAEQVPAHSDKMILRWFCPQEPEADNELETDDSQEQVV